MTNNQNPYESPETANPSPASKRGVRTFFLVMFAALVVWALFLAGGAAFAGNVDVRRGLLVLLCMAGFLSLWGLLLLQRKARLGK